MKREWKQKFAALFAASVMICACLPTAFAATTHIISPNRITTINSLSYSSARRENMDNSGGLLYLYNGFFANYDIEVQKTGYYTATVYGTTLGGNYSTAHILIDDVVGRGLTVVKNEGSTYKGFKTKPFLIEEGKHVLTYSTVGGSTGRVLKIDIEPVRATDDEGYKKVAFKNSYLPTMIEAEDYDRVNGYKTDIPKDFASDYRADGNLLMYEGRNEGEYFISLNETEHTRYTFMADRSGSYDLSVKAEGSAILNIYFDNNEKPLVKKLKNGINSLGSVYIEKGEHTMRVETPDLIALDYFKFKCSTEDGAALSDLDSISDSLTEVTNPVWKEFYVSESGSDKASGDKAHPFKTLKKARDAAAAVSDKMQGDIVINIKEGYYFLDETLNFTNEHSGKNGYRIIYRGESKENPSLISGGIKVLGWQKHNDVIYKAKAPEGISEVRNLYINDYPAVRARSKYLYACRKIYDDPLTTDYTRDGFQIDAENFLKNLTNITDIELVFKCIWASQRYPLTKIERQGESMILYSDPDALARKQTVSYLSPQNGSSFYLENAMEFLDTPGEFYYNKTDGYIYYYPYRADDMSTADVFVAKTEGLVTINGISPEDRVKNLSFENLDFRYGAWDYISGKGLIGRQADEIDTSKDAKILIPQQFMANNADSIYIKDCRFSCLGSGAIGFSNGVSDSKIYGNIIKDISSTGISIGTFDYEKEGNAEVMCENIDVRNNIIKRVAGEYRGSLGVCIYYASGVKVQHNEITDLPYSGLSAGWGWGEYDFDGFGNFKITHNKIANVMTSLDDGNHIYLLGTLNNSEASYNFLTNYEDRTGASGYGGVYFDAASGNSRAHHNVVTNSPSYHMWSGLNWIHNDYVYNTYSTTEKAKGPGDFGSIFFQPATIIDADDSAWNAETKKIQSEAGVEKEYKHLLSLAQKPADKADRLFTVPEAPFSSKNGTWIEAEDFMPGENVGWYKPTPEYNENTYRPEEGVALLEHTAWEGYVIENNGEGHWLKYELDIEKDGKYYLDIRAAHGYSPTAAVQPACNIYIDDVLVLEKIQIPRAETGWFTLLQSKLGSFDLTSGKHTMKFEFKNVGFYVDAFRVHDGSIYAIEDAPKIDDNLPNYDEGVLLYEQ